MDRSTRATVVLRAGTLLLAIALAFGIISYASSQTVSGYNSEQCYGCGSIDSIPARTYVVLTSWNPASPQQMYFFNMSSAPVDAEVYLLNANLSAFNVWIANRSDLPLANVSLYGSEDLVWFSDYVASHGQEVEGQYDVSRANVVVKYFVSDIEPLMAVVTNGNANTSLTFTYYQSNIGVTIDPSLGLWVTGYLAASGAVLVAFGMVLKKKSGGRPTSLSVSPPDSVADNSGARGSRVCLGLRFLAMFQIGEIRSFL